MKAETKLIIQNQMIMNELLSILIKKSVSYSSDIKIKTRNDFDKLEDDMIKTRLEFDNLT